MPAPTCSLPVQAQALDLGSMPYAQAYELQKSLINAKLTGSLTQELFLLVEHTPVYTLGRHAGKENLHHPEAFYQQHGIDIVAIERGGDITYHGPGQLVIYPIWNLRRNRLRVTTLVHRLEEVMQRCCQVYGITGHRDNRNAGIWHGDNKLGSVGIAVRHGISYHGLALNVSNDLKPFSWIDPCGLSQVRMSNLRQESAANASVADLKPRLPHILAEVFHCQVVPQSLTHLETFIPTSLYEYCHDTPQPQA